MIFYPLSKIRAEASEGQSNQRYECMKIWKTFQNRCQLLVQTQFHNLIGFFAMPIFLILTSVGAKNRLTF